jgi:hypothetical protein
MGERADDRLALAVEREIRRRQRQVRIYLLLLLVPLLMGVAAVLFSRDDADRLRTVEASLDSVQPSLDAVRGLDTTLAQVTTAASALRSTAQEVGDLRQRQQVMRARLDSSEVLLRETQRQISEEVKPWRVETALVRVDQVRAALKAQEQEIAGLQKRQMVLMARQDSQIARYPLNADIIGRLKRLELRSDTIRSQIHDKRLYQRP